MTKELVAYIVKQVVNFPDDVSVSVVNNNGASLIEISVNEQDRGKVIGRNGQTIKALRMLVSAIASDEKKVTVDIAK